MGTRTVGWELSNGILSQHFPNHRPFDCRYCATSTSTTGHFDTLNQPPTVNELENFIKGITADDCLSGMEEELSMIRDDMKITCVPSNA
jgi:hypothetical protein